MSVLKSIALFLLLLAVLPIFVSFFLGRSFIYHPTKTPKEMIDALATRPGWQLDTISIDEHTQLVGLIKRPSKGAWILLFGGNADNILGLQSLIMLFEKGAKGSLGLATYSYRGYDGSTGHPSEEALVADASRIVENLKERYGALPSDLNIIGYSLGSGVATQLAASLSKAGTPPRRLILGAPYRSIAGLFNRAVPLIPVGWAARDTYDSSSVITLVKCPILILHGVQDAVIPIEDGRALKALLGERAELIEYPDRGHDLFRDDQPVEQIQRFISDR